MVLHEYARLDLERDAIRLLRLEKGYAAEPVRCELFEAYLHEIDGIPYEALSYTWGDASAKREITVNQQSFIVTANLDTALRALRSPHQDRLLWVDAICIDQASDQEKSHQVGQMRMVYKFAEQVVIWLGPSTEDSDVLMTLAKTLDLHASRSKAWEEEWESMVVANGGPATDMFRRAYNSLEEMLARPWFRRVWILQEAASARSAVVLCGAKYVHSRTFAQLPALLGLGNVDTHAQAVLDIMPGPLRQKSWWTSNRDLKTLLRKFRSSQACDARDRIYALLGISSDAYSGTVIQPDYGADIYTVVQRTIYHLLFRDQGNAAPPAPFWGIDDFFDALEDLPGRVVGWYLANESHRQYKRYQAMMYFPTSTATASQSLLTAAVPARDKAIAQDILDRDAVDVNKHDASGNTALVLALELGKHSIVEMLLARKDLKTDANEAPHPLMIAIRQGAYVEAIIGRDGIDINGYFNTGGTWETPLTMAAKFGRQSIVEMLVTRRDVDVNLKSKCTSELSLSALAIASWKGDESMVKTILCRIDVDTASNSGAMGMSDSPAWLAARNGHKKVVRLFLDRCEGFDAEECMAVAETNNSTIPDELVWESVDSRTLLEFFPSSLRQRVIMKGDS
ncbi:hypothetical protein N8I77_012886 [Diaporthe amygdali]|uniref:Heterokaryon incompatibility domain-containing protein n=1 Tax=Phomopsis amygdali TaxID=1214568 RepID=A0AAD9S1T2_PHOAM|nr:hypothetical protein N8I77_012886 [Diaporthe amygdali]